MSEINEVDRNAHGPMAGWVIVLSNCKQLIGKAAETGKSKPSGEYEWQLTLRPVFELNVQPVQGPQGGVAINYTAVPVMLIASIDGLTIPDGAIVVRCETMSRSEQGRLHAAVNNAEQLQRQLRTADAGISLVTEMPKMPPVARRPG